MRSDAHTSARVLLGLPYSVSRRDSKDSSRENFETFNASSARVRHSSRAPRVFFRVIIFIGTVMRLEKSFFGNLLSFFLFFFFFFQFSSTKAVRASRHNLVFSSYVSDRSADRRRFRSRTKSEISPPFIYLSAVSPSTGAREANTYTYTAPTAKVFGRNGFYEPRTRCAAWAARSNPAG